MIEYLNSGLGMWFILLVVPISGINIDVGSWALFRAKPEFQRAPKLFRSTMETSCQVRRLSY